MTSTTTWLLLAGVLGAAACSSGHDAADAALLADGRSGGDDAASPAVDAGHERAGNCVPSGPEICDGQDNDCDGVVDNGFSWQGLPVGARCYPGVGACGVMGTVVCVDPSTAACSAMPGQPDDTFHTSAAPNGSWDWNCNNGVDRQYPLLSCEGAAAGACPANGWTSAPGTSGDCGQTLIQRACTPGGSGCVSTGAEQTVQEGCK